MKKYYQDETKKALENFQITDDHVSLKLIYAVAEVKKAAAYANNRIGRLENKKYTAIGRAVDEILKGKYDNEFITDQIQGGAGTSTNMNVNEVISSRAQEFLNNDTVVHPHDDANMGQSTNDVIPTAVRIMLLRLIDDLIDEMKLLSKSLAKKEKEFKSIIKVGRTHMQDAVPMTLGQSFKAYKTFVDRNIKRFEENKKYLYSTNLGATAIGSAINSSKEYIKLSNKKLAEITKYPMKGASDLFDSTQNSDNFLFIAYVLNTFTAGLNKIVNDLRFLSCGPRAGIGELILPELQKGSSIMPGKVNPVILEMMNQICYQIFGNCNVALHFTINSQLELNVMFPIYIKNMLEAFTILTNGLKTFREKVIIGIKVDNEKISFLFSNSLCTATALNRYIGYDKTAQLVKKAVKNKTGLIDELRKAKILTEAEILKILDVKTLTTPSDKFFKRKK